MAEENNCKRVGEFLVKIGAMKPWQVENILAAQGAGDGRVFGELAIAFGYIDDKALMEHVETRTDNSTVESR